MKLMFFKHVNSFLFVAAGVAVLNASCSKVDDLYNKPEGDGDNTELLPNGQVPANFNWATTQVVDVRIAIDDEFNGKYLYKVELFDKEPHAEEASLLGAGSVKQGQDFVSQVSIPAGIPYIYVRITDPRGSISYAQLEVKGNSAVMNPSGSTAVAKVAAVNARSFNLLASTTGTASAQKVNAPAVPANAYVLEGNKDADWSTVNSNKVFVVKKGTTFTGNVALNSGIEGVTVYVEGTWDRSNSDITIGSRNTVIVLADGQLKAKELSMPSQTITFTNFGKTSLTTLSANNTSTIANHGTLTIAERFNVPANTTVANTGTLIAKDMTINSNGKLTNTGSVTWKGRLEIPSEAEFLNEGAAVVPTMVMNATGVVTNKGTMTIDVAEFTNGTLNVNCFTSIGKLTVNGTKVNIQEGARLDINTISVSGGGIYALASGAILDVKTSAKFNTQKNTIRAAKGATRAVARFKKIEFEGYMSMQYEGSLEVATTNHPANPQWTPVYGAESSVRIVDYAGITTVIAGTNCNAGGFNTPNTNPPGDQTLDQVVLGTYSFAFEDHWPTRTKVDYDMNDLVVDIQIVKHQTKDNKIQKVVLKNKIRAVGANKRLAGAIQLDNVLASAVKSVTYSKRDLVGKVLPLSPIGVESGQKQAVVTIVDDAHSAFGLTNTGFIFTNNGAYAPLETEITIEFSTPLANFTYDDLNPFIINFAQNQGGRNEVHLVGRKPTDKINASLLKREQGPDGELSATDPFKTKNNYPFALSLPLSFKYPYEGQIVTKFYPDMEAWMRSGGTTNQNWFLNYKP